MPKPLLSSLAASRRAGALVATTLLASALGLSACSSTSSTSPTGSSSNGTSSNGTSSNGTSSNGGVTTTTAPKLIPATGAVADAANKAVLSAVQSSAPNADPTFFMVSTYVSPVDKNWAMFVVKPTLAGLTSVSNFSGYIHHTSGWGLVSYGATNVGCPLAGRSQREIVPAGVLASFGHSCPKNG